MPFVMALWTAFVAIVPGLVMRVMIAAGVSVVAYNGVSALLDYSLDAFVTQTQGMSALAKSLLGVVRIDDAVSVMFSAYTTRLVFAGLTSTGALKKVLWRPNQQGELF